MIPILYPREETKFNSNGVGRLVECVSFTVTEERNGIYEAEFKYPITGSHYADIEEGMIVYAIHDDTKLPQPFRIYGRSAPLFGMVTFYAHHISYSLGNIVLTPFTASSCAAALSAMKTNAVGYNPFAFWTDKAVSGTYTLRAPAPCRGALGGTAGSILDVYGTGEYEFDHWNVKLYVNRGSDTGIRIQYGKNLSDLVHETDYSGIYSAVVPYWQDPNDPTNIVTLPEQFIVAPEGLLQSDVWTDESGNEMTDQSGNVFEFDYHEMTMATMDLTAEFDEQPTIGQLRTLAQNRLDASEAWLPDDNVTIDFVQLWQTAEYASVAPLERLSLCDTVDVYYPALGVVAKKRKIVRVVYDVLLERYSSMEIGTAKTSFADVVKASTEQVVAQNYPSKSMMAEAIDSATAQISGAHGGYIKYIYDADGNPTDLLIMDAPDEAQAVKIWRWNMGGLGYSSDGGRTYGLAMTQDGQIVADYITTGTLVANLIKAGVLSDLAGKFSFNLETGKIVASDGEFSGIINADSGTLGPFTVTSTGLSYGSVAASGGGGMEITPYHFIYALQRGSSNQTVKLTFGEQYLEWAHAAPGATNYTGDVFINVTDEIFNIWFGGYDPQVAKKRFFQAYAKQGTSGGVVSDDISSITMFASVTVSYDLSAMKNMTVHGRLGTQGGLSSTGGTVSLVGKTTVQGDFTVTQGTKSREVSTADYGDRLLYCYETPSPMFGDVGEGVIGEDGTCYIWIDPILAETIRASGYQVFLQRYGQGDAYVAERKADYFVVMGAAGTAFGWEIKARQADFAEKRFEKDIGEASIGTSEDYGQMAADHIEEIRSGRYAA